MSRRFLRPLLAACLCCGFAFATLTALADRPSSDRALTLQLLSTLQTDAAPTASAVARPLSEARSALARADSAAAAGDAPNARLLEGLARQWAELAFDLRRAVEISHDAGAAQQAAADAAQRVQRARAMLDESTVRRARAQGELERLTEQAADAGVPMPPPRKPAPTAPKPKAGKP
jgi:hypothetical protein